MGTPLRNSRDAGVSGWWGKIRPGPIGPTRIFSLRHMESHGDFETEGHTITFFKDHPGNKKHITAHWGCGQGSKASSIDKAGSRLWAHPRGMPQLNLACGCFTEVVPSQLGPGG